MALPLSIDIALSHLLHRRRQTAVSLIGVVLGVGFFIGIASMMQGFQRDFIEKVIEVQPHIVMKDEYREPQLQSVEKAFPGGAIALRGLKARDEVRGIRHVGEILSILGETEGMYVAPRLTGEVLLRYGSKDVSASIIGIDPVRDRLVSDIEGDLIEGRLDDLYSVANGIILGEGVANKAGVKMGDTMSVISPAGVVLKMKVVGIINTGITSIDNFETYALLKKVQILQNRSNVINRVNVRLDDIGLAAESASLIEARFGYRTESWEEMSRNVLGIFVIQNGIMYSTVGAILIVACFGIFNVISTVIYEKARDIAILKSIGFSEGDIRLIFLLEGLLVGLVGTLIGWGLGFGIVEFLGSIEFEIEGFIRSQGFVLYKTINHYLIGGGVAIASSTFAAWLPARRASALNPVDIVRGAG